MIKDYINVTYESASRLSAAERRFIAGYFAPFNKDGTFKSPQVLAELIAEWSEFFFGQPDSGPHWHVRCRIPEFHKSIYRDLMNEERLYYITAPSEFGKTTVACLFYPLYRAYYRLDPYITVGGSTQLLSEEEHLFNIKFEIEDNELLNVVYGEQKPSLHMSRKKRSKPWASDEIELENGVYIRALGCLGRIRGRKRANQRPTLVIIDDPETAADVESDAVLKAHRRWLFRDVMYRIDKEYGKIRIIGNMISESCLLAVLKRDPAWKGHDYAALDENGRSIWEERFPTAELMLERERAVASGRFEEFMYERMNRPVKSLTRKLEGYVVANMTFQRRYDQNLLFLNNNFDRPIVVNFFLGIDPEVDADDVGARAFITIARGYINEGSYKRDVLFVYDCLYKALDISDVLNEIKKHHEIYHYTGVAIEVNSVQRIFKGYIQQYMATDPFYQRHPFRFFPIQNYGKSKISRILRLQPKINNGSVYVAPHLRELMDEMRDFGTFKNEGLHLLDALEMADREAYPPLEEVREYSKDDLPPDFYESETPALSFDWRIIPSIKV